MDEWLWSNGGMILTGENWSTGTKTLYSVGGRWMNENGATMEWYWQGKTEVLGEKHYTVWVVDEWMSMEQWWNDNDRGKLKYWEKKHYTVWVVDGWICTEQWWNDTDRSWKKYLDRNLCQCHYVHHEFYVDRHGKKPGLRDEKKVNKRLNHGKAVCLLDRWLQHSWVRYFITYLYLHVYAGFPWVWPHFCVILTCVTPHARKCVVTKPAAGRLCSSSSE